MTKTIHIHLPALLRKPVAKVKDAETSVQYKGWTIKQNPASLKWYAKTAKNGSGAGAMSDLVKGFKSVEEAKKAIDAVEDDSTKDAREQKFGLPVYTEEEIKQKIRNGEWEAETDVVKGKRVEMRKGSKRFQVYVKDAKAKDAGRYRAVRWNGDSKGPTGSWDEVKRAAEEYLRAELKKGSHKVVWIYPLKEDGKTDMSRDPQAIRSIHLN